MKNIKKIISIFTIGTMTALLLAGCGSKAAATSAAVNSNAKTDTAQQAPKSMETIYSNVLKELVANKAITQAQADKVLAAVKNRQTEQSQQTEQNQQMQQNKRCSKNDRNKAGTWYKA